MKECDIMALTNEDLQAIAALMDEKVNPIRTDIQDMKTDINDMKTDINNMKSDINDMKTDIINMKSDINKLSDRIEVLEIKQDVTSRKIEDLTYRVASLEHYSKKEFTKNNDQIETLITVLEVKNILPKQA
jgi:predicted  nucleic acid-binding Zn-ribbon protein